MNEKVNPLANLSKEIRDMIDDSYRAGMPPEEIGVKFALDIDDVSFYIENFLAPPRSRYERLEGIVDDLEEVVINTKFDIDAGQGNAMLLQSYQRLMSEYRIAIAELDDLKQPEDVVDEIIEKILNPFLVDVIRVSTEETKKLEEEMLKLDVNSRDAKAVSVDVFKRLTNAVKRTLEASRSNLNAYFGVKDKKSKDDAFFKERSLQ